MFKGMMVCMLSTTLNIQITVITCTSNNRSSVVANFGFVCIKHEWFQSFSRYMYMKHGGNFDCVFDKASIYMSMILFNKNIELLNGAMFCIYIKKRYVSVF